MALALMSRSASELRLDDSYGAVDSRILTSFSNYAIKTRYSIKKSKG